VRRLVLAAKASLATPLRGYAGSAGLAACFAAGVFAPPASGSQLIDRDARNVRLAVTGGGKTAVLTYRAHGRIWHVRAWGAINARFPNPRVPQVQFRIRRDARPIGNRCGRYDGPNGAHVAHERQMNALQDQVTTGDRLCRRH
jgi:hypothetical protein